MAGNARFELTSASPDSSFAGNFQNGQRGYAVPTLDRSTSFRDGADSRNFASGKANSRASASSGEVTTLSQCLMLEPMPIVLGDPKNARSVDLKRVLGSSVGSSSEDNSFGAAHLKNPSPGAVEELKRLRASVADTCFKASGRAKKLDDHLNKLNKYCEAVSSKKQQQRNDMITNERSGSTLKIGSLAECRNSGALRQPLMVSKERDLLKDTNADPDMVEEKIRRLPAGGEGWDKKMKRKRSVGAVFSRSVDNDGELKRTMHHKLPSESSLQSGDSTHGFRMNSREDNHGTGPGPILKGKASRAPRSGSMVAAHSASNNPRISGTLESWEQPQAVNKTPTVAGANNRKRSIPAGSSSPPITQWMQSEGCSPSDFSSRLSTGGTNASLPTKSSASGNQNTKLKPENVPSPARFSESEESGAGEIRIKEKGLDRGDVEEKDGNAAQNVGTSTVPMKKNKIMVKEEIGEGVRRQGRSGRVSPFSRTSISPTREKMDNLMPAKPLRNARPGSDKNGSKSGRPLKKQSERKGFSRLGHMASGGSPDCSADDTFLAVSLSTLSSAYAALIAWAVGESEDDREELLVAANLACSSSLDACPSAFWKTVESLFTPIGLYEKSYLSEQLKLAEGSRTSSYQNCSHENAVQWKSDDYVPEEIAAPDSLSIGRNRHMKNKIGLKNSSDGLEFVEQLQNSSVFGCSEAEKRYDMVTPLYQRILSAVIVEDEIEESEETGFGRPRGSVNDSCLLISAESKQMDKLDLCDPTFGVQTQKNGNTHIIFSCNGNADFDRSSNAQEVLQRDSGYMHSEVEVLVRLSRCDYVPQNMQTDNCGISSFDGQYEQMGIEEKLILELQSIGLFVKAVPALDDKEDEVVINNEIVQLERGLHEQIGKKKSCLDKIYMAIEEGKNIGRRDSEQVAMDKLVELAYKKLLSKRKELLLDDVGGAVFRASSALGILDGAKGKRSERERDRDPSTRNTIVKAGRSSMGGSKGERKAKSKPKQKTAQLSTSANGFVNKFTDTTNSVHPSASGSGESANSGNRKKDVRFMSSGNVPPVSSNDMESMDFANLPLNDIDGIEELGVESDIGGAQDLNSWFNFDVDGLQDHDSIGLEIPMDDLAELNMF
ncbi:UNVERIFIED_CONTAM: hypothetical protein Sradi_1996200 [Sesamum radiatum]|uniref:Uncharacterized protein n=1 Tax=Sesamum radiatum TaxID=300843 RepID=A0AAW2TG10_SESRA